MSWRDHYGFYQHSAPRVTHGGIKAQSRKGAFGEKWWARRWIATLESFQIGARLGRGRNYARNGQVLSVEVEKGRVQARVQGSRPTPYDVLIKVKTFSSGDCVRLGRALAGQALYAAKLLAGEMPGDIEKVLEKMGFSLFPGKLRDLQTRCSCPDSSNPCKHVAAVYYLLGEEFDRDPFLIFKLRGLNRDRLMALMGREEAKAGGRGKRKGGAKIEPVMAEKPDPLSTDAQLFWGGKELPSGWLGGVRTPPLHAALLKRLGSFPFWRADERFLEAVEAVYPGASEKGRKILAG
ncbi:MAG: SWIM zinc finger family protein [Verrucomicrobiae bacterium]|nr:SWIM zinc finger family protein [Verrucomicrobiae bacterium]